MSEKRLGMLIDLALCIGCNACVVACKMENDVPLGCFNTWVESWDVEDGERTRRANVPKQCNHCENPQCVKVCPTGASYVADDGTVQIDAENYREKREESLERLAQKVAGKVVKYRRNVTLEPMNAYERHVIHTALQDTQYITTFSIGTEPNRRVVVSYDRTKQ